MREILLALLPAVVSKVVLSSAPVAARGAVHRSTRPAAPSRLRIADQWQKLNVVLYRAATSATNVKTLQKSAAQQLDLAQYGLQTLVDDLAAVMTIPGRRPPAPVHVLGTARAMATRPAAHAA